MRLALVVLLSACTPAAQGLSASDVQQRLILNGSAPTEAHHDAVVSLHRVSGDTVTTPFCSGTLVAERWVLTAAHCADEDGPSELLVKFGDDGWDLSLPTHSVASLTLHPDWDPVSLAGDLALVELVDPATFARPVPLLPAARGLTDEDVGVDAELAGFGTREDGASGALLQVVRPVAAVRSAEWEVDQGDGSVGVGGACHGDSGGPGFVARDGGVYVAGVISAGDPECVDFAVLGRVDTQEGWLGEVMGLEAFEPAAPEPEVPEQPTDGDWVEDGVLSFVGEVEEGGWAHHSYSAPGPGWHTLALYGPDDADLDLFLATEGSRGRLRVRARSTGPGAVEVVQVEAPVGGTFTVGVQGASGGGAYELWVEHPE